MGIVRFDQPTILLVADHFARAAYVAGDDGQGSCGRFEDSVAVTFIAAGQYE
jgi:hypothetical protein